MAIFGNMSITNAGQTLYTKAQAGKPIVFTKLSIGSGLIGTQNPATLSTLVEQQFDIPITSIIPNTLEQSAAISGTISNTNMLASIYICEIGLWAMDPDVGLILYGYASAGTQGDYMAAATLGAYSWLYQVNAAIGNAANVTANISSILYDYSILGTDPTLTVIGGGNQKVINKSIDTILGTHLADSMLLDDDIKGTISYPTIVGNKINRVDHKIGGTIIRSDVSTYTTNLITEVRTIIATGKTLTIKLHTDTLQQEMI